MQDLIVQVQSICAKPEDMILVTFGQDFDFDEIQTSIEALNKCFPDLKFIGNREGMITNITVIDTPIKPVFHFDWSESKDGN